MTVLEALKQSIAELNQVNVPISMIQQIGVPVQKAVALIQASVDALEKAALQPPEEGQEAAEGAGRESEPEEFMSDEVDIFGEAELPKDEKAGEEHDEHADV